MAPTRRDLAKVLSSLAVVGSTAPIAEKIGAMGEVLASVSGEESSPISPAAFAWEVDGYVSETFSRYSDDIDSEIHAMWRLAEAEMRRKHPELREVGEWSRFVDMTFDFVVAAFGAGIKRGAVIESARRELIPERVLCWTCGGDGCGRLDEYKSDPDTVCEACGGTGMMDNPGA